jgi:hypothetical protein
MSAEIFDPADVPQLLLAGTGVLARDHSHVGPGPLSKQSMRRSHQAEIMFVAGLDPIPNRCPISQWLENQQTVNFSLTTFKRPAVILTWTLKFSCIP